MRINVETSGGGGAVLVVAGALIAGHGGDVSSALTAVAIALAVVVVLALAVVVGLVVYRSRRRDERQWYPPPYAVRQVRADLVPPPVQAAERPAIGAPVMRLDPGQLAELADLLRQQEPR